jgi:hypothetical protein
MEVSELLLDEATHTYTYNGRVVPSVTRILEILHDFRSVPADVLDAARQFGTHVHSAIQLELEGTLDHETLDPNLKPYVDAAMRFIVDAGITVLDYEVRVYNKTHDYAGTADLIGEVHPYRRKPQRVIVDWKTGLLPRTVGPQLAAYAHALDGPHLRWAVQLCPGGSVPFKLAERKDPSDWSVFISCRNLHNWRNQ